MAQKNNTITLDIAKLLYIYGFALWITIITFNNINDPGTNIFFLNNMLEMNNFDLKKSVVGEGLLWRSLKLPYLATFMLWFIIAIELIIDYLMWRAFFSLLKDILAKKPASIETIDKVNIAFCWMLGLFASFITGGMWFGYWIHMGAFQMVHLTGIIMSVLGLILFNFQKKDSSESI